MITLRGEAIEKKSASRSIARVNLMNAPRLARGGKGT
jgi:hypothetical protein